MVYFILEDVENGVKSMKKWNDQTENSHGLFRICLTILYENGHNPSVSKELLQDYFHKYENKAVEFIIKSLKVVAAWSLEFELIQRVYRHQLFS